MKGFEYRSKKDKILCFLKLFWCRVEKILEGDEIRSKWPVARPEFEVFTE